MGPSRITAALKMGGPSAARRRLAARNDWTRAGASPRCAKGGALKLMRKLLKKYGIVPDKLITDELRSYAAIILGTQNAMNAVDGATIELRIRISRPDEGRGRCKDSRARIRAKISLSACSSPERLLLNATNDVFVGRRIKTKGKAWQMPQGGIA